MLMTIHQPEYIPWLGFFNKLSYVSTYIALDNVQYRHKYFQNRNKVCTANGPVWLNVPIEKKGSRSSKIKDIKINNLTNWKEKTKKTIFYTYKKSKYFNDYFCYFDSLYSKEWEYLADLNLDIIENMLLFLGLDIKVIRASQINVDGKGESLILDICKKFKPNIYISGKSGIAGHGSRYENNFIEAGIAVKYQNFKHPAYPQSNNSCEFVSNMSIIDLLFNCGKDSINIIRSTGGVLL